LEHRQRSGEAVRRALVESQTQLTTPKGAGPKGGATLGYKGKKSKSMHRRSGEMAMQGPYSYGEAGHQGHFPPG
jgi:hypothetical protein